jgi:acetyl esterase/lipase
MVAISAEYRIRSEHGTSPFECVADGKSAVRWVREHAGDLGIDPGRIAAGGGSAGGHVAACTGIIAGFDDEEDSEISSVPDTMVLFNPAVELSERALPGLNETEDDAVIGFNAQMQEISPADHVRAGLPPTIIFHGTGDQVVLFDCIERFRDAMREAGNRCEVVAFDGKPHAFFNYGREEDNASFTATLRAADRFLASLGYLSGEPTLQEGGTWPGKKD